MPAGKLRSRLDFQQRTISDDGYGGQVTGEFQTIFTTAAELIPRLGSEAVLSARLQGLQPYTVRVRSCTSTRSVDATWRAVDTRAGSVFEITSPPVNVSQKNDYIVMLATVGAQTAA